MTAALGVYGEDPATVAIFESVLGVKADMVTAFCGPSANSWSNAILDTNWVASLAFGVPLDWTVLPMPQQSGSLSAAAAGNYDGYWKQEAQIIAKAQPSGNIVIRPFHEFNGNWYSWASGGREQTFIQAWQQFVDVFRGVSNRFKFEWTVNQGSSTSVSNPELAYPGDKYVDIIGMDASYETQYQGNDPNAAFNTMLTETYGLNWLANFAAKHGKPMSFPEWGVDSDNAGPYIKDFANWVNTHNVAYESYFNSSSGFNLTLDNGQFPHAAAAYMTAFANS